jgi:hypothetical protein
VRGLIAAAFTQRDSGWALSSVSREAIAAALDQQEATSGTASENSAVCSRGSGSLRGLKEALKPMP